jgi:hypothetical protein
MTGAYSDSVAQMRVQTTPGAIGTESLSISLSDELERLRYVIARMAGKAIWYDAPNTSLAAATKADMQGPVSTTLSVTPAQVQNHPGVSKINALIGSAGNIATGYGLNSVTKVGTGDYQLNFTTPFISTSYAVVVTLENAAGYAIVPTVNRAVGTCRIQTRDTTNTAIDQGFNVSIFGTQ